MPFDVMTETPAIRRARLIEALRQPIEDWNFCNFEQCACALAKRVGMITDHLNIEELASAVGISGANACAIFTTEDPYDVECMRDVTPAMGAEALEKIG